MGLKILWQSNAPWVRTGYGVQTKLTCERIQASGRHEICGLFAFYGLEGGPIHWNGIPVVPRQANSHPFGADLLPFYSQRHKADIVITLIDAWVMEPQAYPPDVRWCPYFPIDHEPTPPAVLDKVSKAFARIVYSKSAQAEMERVGLTCHYVPHSVDTKNAYFPVLQAEARSTIGLPQDKFIVGVVAANKGYPSRKSYPELIEAFAEFAKENPDALLWLHTNPGGNDGMGGVEIPSLIQYYGLQNRVALVNTTEYNAGLDDNFMRNLYSSFDVLLNPAMGEGFGVPMAEAQACGCPVITGDWTSQSELCGAGWLIPKAEATRQMTLQYSHQYRPEPKAIYKRLVSAYEHKQEQPAIYAAMRESARAFAVNNYDADMVMEEYWLPALDAIEARINSAKALENRFQEAMGRAAA